MTIESLAQRIEHAASPEWYCTAVAACLERNGGDLEGAIELAETIQMDELFERHHPRHGDGKFREANKSKWAQTRHRNERARRHAEKKPRDTGPKSSNRQAVEEALDDPELQQQLLRIAGKVGKDRKRVMPGPEDVVQEAVARALNEADRVDLTDVHGWLRLKTKQATDDALKRAGTKKRGKGKTRSLDTEMDVAEKPTSDLDPKEEVIEEAMQDESVPEKDRKILSAYYGLKRMPKTRHTAAQRKAAERSRAKLKPAVQEVYDKREKAREQAGPPSTEDVPSIHTGEVASGPKQKPAETHMPEDRQWRKAGMTAAAHEGKVWHQKPPEHVTFTLVHKLAHRLHLSPEQTEAIHNIVKKPAQFDEDESFQPRKPPRVMVGRWGA